jgi:hypothetical protein
MEIDHTQREKKQLAKNREREIRKIVPPCSKVPTKEFKKNYDKINWNK